MIKKIALLLFLSITWCLQSQVWKRSYPGPIGGSLSYQMIYDYRPDVGGAVVITNGQTNHILHSYNKSGDIFFNKNLAFYSVSNVRVNAKGHRLVSGLTHVGFSYLYQITVFDSLGMQIYSTVFPYSSSNDEFQFMTTKNGQLLMFSADDSYSTIFPGSLYLHTLHEYVTKLDTAMSLVWQNTLTFSDTGYSTPSPKASHFYAPTELRDGTVMYLHSNKASLPGSVNLERIDQNGSLISSVNFCNFFSPYVGADSLGYFLSFSTKDTCYNLIGYKYSPAGFSPTEYFMLKINANGSIVNSISSFSLAYTSAVETSNGDLFVTFVNLLNPNSAIAEGIMVLDKHFQLKSIHPSQSLEYFSTLMSANHEGGVHLGGFNNDPNTTFNFGYDLINTDSLFNCYPNKLTGSIITDNNKNCTADLSDNNNAYKSISCFDGQSNYYVYSKSNGNYTVTLPNGTYTVTHNAGVYKNTICPTSAVVFALNTSSGIATQNYFDTIMPNVNDLKITLIGDPFWFGATGYISAFYQNVGTQTVSCTIKLLKDPAFSFSFSIPSGATLSGDTAIFPISNLLPDSSGFVGICLAPSPTMNFGAQIIFKASISNNLPDSDNSNNSDSIVNMYLGALRAAAPSLSVSTSNNMNVNKPKDVYGNEELFYKIRFQNTTGAFVKDVLIIDTLSDYLDYTTLKIVSASHDYDFSLNSKGKLMIKFQGVNLQDSVLNESQSKGYLIYSIKPKTNWPFGKLIKNSANIYFDYLNVVTTNQTVNQKLLTVGISDYSKNAANDLLIYPNPAKDKLHIKLSGISDVNSIQLYNLTGQLVFVKDIKQQIQLLLLNITELENGFYFIKLNCQNGNQTNKIIIDK